MEFRGAEAARPIGFASWKTVLSFGRHGEDGYAKAEIAWKFMKATRMLAIIKEVVNYKLVGGLPLPRGDARY